MMEEAAGPEGGQVPKNNSPTKRESMETVVVGENAT
jgi:hypothetical protein